MTFLNFCAIGLINCSLHAQSSAQYKSIEVRSPFRMRVVYHTYMHSYTHEAIGLNYMLHILYLILHIMACMYSAVSYTQDMLELTAGLFENVTTLNSVIEKIMIGVLKLLPSQACRVLMVDSDPPGVRIMQVQFRHSVITSIQNHPVISCIKHNNYGMMHNNNTNVGLCPDGVLCCIRNVAACD